IGAAYYAYILKPQTGQKLADTFGAAYRTLQNKYYVDELYDTLFVQPTKNASREVLWHVVDEGAIDGTANGLATGARAGGAVARMMQSGLIRSYAAWIVIGAVSVLLYMGLVFTK